ASPENKVLLIEVLAHRGYPGSFQAINSLLSDSDANVKKAAFAALPAVSRSSDLPVLIALMNTNGDERSVQRAIANVVEFSANKDKDIESVLSHYKTQNDQQKIKYLGILSGIGGQNALNAVVESSKSNDATLKNASILALANWKEGTALQTLIDLSKTTKDAAQLDSILKGLARLTASSKISEERKRLIDRAAMEVAQTTTHRQLL